MPRRRAADGADAGEELAEHAAALARSGTKDALIRHLKAAAGLLEQLPQDSSGKEQAQGVVKALQARRVLDHKDVEVQICAAQCFCQTLRIWAPDVPFADAEAQAAMFGWLLAAFRRLRKGGDPHFHKCLVILHTAAQTKCCVLLYDLKVEAEEVAELVQSVFSALLDAIGEDTVDSLQEPVLHLLRGMLAEADHISQAVLETVLAGLLPPKSEKNPALARVTAALLARAEAAVRPALQGLLVSLIEGSAKDSSLKHDRHTLLYKVYQLSPQTLLPVLPKLAAELSLDDGAKRGEALQLLGQLLALRGNGLDTAHEELWAAFLRRAVDQKAELRCAFLELCPGVAAGCQPNSQPALLEAMVGRLMDFEDKVRGAAVAAICDAAAKAPEAVTQKALEEVATRLRDRKPAVRRETAKRLLAFFNARSKAAAGHEILPATEELVLWIPGRVCAAAQRDPEELLHAVLDGPLSKGLLPPGLTAAAAARLLGVVYLESSQQERAAIMCLSRIQTATRAHLRAFLEARAAAGPEGREASPPAPGSAGARLAAAMEGLARTFKDRGKARELLLKLRRHADNHLFRALERLLAPSADAAALTKEAAQRAGGRGSLPDLCRQLAARLAPGMLPPPQLAAAVQLLLDNGPDDDFGQALLALLADAAAAAPHAFAGMAAQVEQLLDQEDSELSWLAARILAHAGRAMRRAGEEQAAAAEAFAPAMVRLCSEGGRRGAKAAVRALAAILEPQAAQERLAALCPDLLAGVGPSITGVLARLEALATVARIAPDAFAPHAEAFLATTLEELDGVDAGAVPAQEAAAYAPLWACGDAGDIFRARVLKAAARACVPDDPSARPPAGLLAGLPRLQDALLQELAAGEADLPPDSEPEASPVDAERLKSLGFRRLCAAAALLRLARLHDSRLAVDGYLQLSLAVQDNLSQVRAEVAQKVMRLLTRAEWQAGGSKLATKHAAMLPLAAVDPVEQLRQGALAALCRFTAGRRAAAARAVGAGAAAGNCGAALHTQPEFLLPYLVQILAHHPDWPSPELVAADPQQQLQPFVDILHMALAALMDLQGPQQATVASHARCAKLLRTIKTTEDATPMPATQALHQACDLGLLVARRLLVKACGSENLPEAPRLAGGCPLPLQLYRPLSDRRAEKRADGATLPPGFRLQLPRTLELQGGGSKKRAAESSAAAHGGRTKAARTTPAGKERQSSERKPARSSARKAAGSAKRTAPVRSGVPGSSAAALRAADSTTASSSGAGDAAWEPSASARRRQPSTAAAPATAAQESPERGGGGEAAAEDSAERSPVLSGPSPMLAGASPALPEASGGAGEDAATKPAAAAPRPKRRNRELAALQQAAAEMGLDANPRSPRSLRPSRSPRQAGPSQQWAGSSQKLGSGSLGRELSLPPPSQSPARSRQRGLLEELRALTESDDESEAARKRAKKAATPKAKPPAGRKRQGKGKG